jgi:hypothetical protein
MVPATTSVQIATIETRLIRNRKLLVDSWFQDRLKELNFFQIDSNRVTPAAEIGVAKSQIDSAGDFEDRKPCGDMGRIRCA